jgi:hypothetical protein
VRQTVAHLPGGGERSAIRCSRTFRRFSPEWFGPVKNYAMWGRIADKDRMPVVNTPFRPGASSRIGSPRFFFAVNSSTCMCVSSL